MTGQEAKFRYVSKKTEETTSFNSKNSWPVSQELISRLGNHATTCNHTFFSQVFCVINVEWLGWGSLALLSSAAGRFYAGLWKASGGNAGRHVLLWQGRRLRAPDHLIGWMGIYIILKGLASLGIFAPILTYFHMNSGLIGSFFAYNIIFHHHPFRNSQNRAHSYWTY